MRVVDILRKKRRGLPLEGEEIQSFIDGFTDGRIPDYQASAFLMAVCLKGMDGDETRALTEAMLASGDVFDFDDVPGPKIDKHSTGGVGDKTSLIIAPLAAACGVKVPMITGRALGHSGGTLDKLEAIPGFNVALDRERFKAVVATVGCSLIGQTEDIAPADRKLYALRDVTATIESLPLITGSILSKKLAEGISGLVLDVKYGNGAFMKTTADAEELASLLTETAASMGKNVVALITHMEQPLGRYVGNAHEVDESIAVLKGDGPDDLTELSLTLTAHMILLGGLADTLEDAMTKARNAVADGTGLQKFQGFVEAQGGDPRVVDDPNHLPQASAEKQVTAQQSGYVVEIATEAVGHAAMALGAGRQRVDDTIDHAAGLVIHRKLGDAVQTGDRLVTMHYNHEGGVAEAETRLAHAYRIDDSPPPIPPLIHSILLKEP